MIVHTINHKTITDFVETEFDEQEPIVGFYLELHKNGQLKGSYMTDKRYKPSCNIELIKAFAEKLSLDSNRVWMNIPVELYLEEYRNFMLKECSKMHKKWSSVSFDDICQMFAEALVKCHNKNGYILNSRLILRSFYNLVYSFIRKNFNAMTNTISIEEPLYESDGEEVTILDMMEDESCNPDRIMEEQLLEEDKIEKLNLIKSTLKELGYSERIYNNILFELEKHAQSRETRRIIERIRERLKRDAWI